MRTSARDNPAKAEEFYGLLQKRESRCVRQDRIDFREGHAKRLMAKRRRPLRGQPLERKPKRVGWEVVGGVLMFRVFVCGGASWTSSSPLGPNPLPEGCWFGSRICRRKFPVVEGLFFVLVFG